MASPHVFQKWACAQCLKLHISESLAAACCPSGVMPVYCCSCGGEYLTESAALRCCEAPSIETLIPAEELEAAGQLRLFV